LDETNAKLQELTQREKELVSQMDGLTKQKQQWQSSAAVVAAFDKEIEKTNAEIKSTRKSIDDLSKATKAMPGKAAADMATQSFKTMRREIEEQIKQLRLAGKTGTEEYQKLIEQAGELTNIQKNVTREIGNMASNTGAFDAVLEGTQLIAGGFSVAQGAAAMFGAESEDLQKVMVKLQSAIAITTGLQQVQNALRKESSIMQGIETFQTMAAAKAETIRAASTAAGTKATIGATIAQKAWNLAASANPYVLLAMAIISVVGAIALFSSGADSASEKSKKYKSTTDDLRFATKEARDEHDKFNQSIRDIQIEIDLATGKITQYQAALLKISNSTEDAIAEINKNTEEDINKINEKYDSFGKKFGNALSNSWKFWKSGGQSAIEYQIEWQNKILETKEKYNDKTKSALKKGNDELEKENKRNNTRILKQNEDLYNENLKGLEGSLSKIETARRRDVEIAQSDNETIKEKNKMRLANDQLVLNNIEEINKNYDNKAAEARKAESERIKSENDKRKAEIIKSEQDLASEKIKAMDEGATKEIESIKETLKRRLSEIKGNSQAEIELRKQLEANAQAEIQKIIDKYDSDRMKSEIETEIAITNAYLAEVEKGSNEEFELRKQLLDKKAALDISGVKASTDSEELKAAKILEINANLNRDLKDLLEEQVKNAEESAKDEADKRTKAAILATTQQYEQGKISKSQYEKQLSDISIKSLEDEIKERKAKGQDTVELEQKLSEKRIEIAEREKQIRMQLFNELFNAMSSIGNTLFDMNKQNLDQEMADLEQQYAAKKEAAEGNAALQSRLDDELARKQLEIKRKQAKAEKEQAIFNATINGIVAVVNALTAMPVWLGIAMAVIVGATVAAQIAAISAKPLPKYWKGRKGGKGEFAMVGEYGPEIAWIPSGSSLMPAHETRKAMKGDGKAFDRWNMPRIEPKFSAPSINRQLVSQVLQNQGREDRILLNIDYDKLGKAVAKHAKYPKQKDVSISLDTSGLTVTEGNTTTHVLNTKYRN